MLTKIKTALSAAVIIDSVFAPLAITAANAA